MRAFGAKGDGATKDTAAVQRALDACAQAGGGRGIHVQCFFSNSHPKGVDISDISFERISIRDVVEAVNVGVGAPGAARLENIRFREVTAEGGSPSLVCGTRAVRVKGVTFTDCSFNVAGPAAAKGEVFRIERADAVSFDNCEFNGVPATAARHAFSIRDAAPPAFNCR